MISLIKEAFKRFTNNERKMSWTDNRRVKITLLRESPQKQNVVVEFEVSEEKRINFQKALEYVLAAFVNVGGIIKPFIEMTDSETHEPCAIEIQVAGFHDKLTPILQNSLGELSSYSIRSR